MRHADKLETLPTDRLVPYARNARTHSPEQVAAVARSIQRFGFTNPVLIDAEDGIVAGHGRVLAAKSLGVASVPCLRVGWLTEAEKRAYVLADNKLAELAGWDDDLLAGELRALQGEDFDLSLIGFDHGELDDLLIEKTAGKTDPDATPPVQAEAITRHGDVWVLGRHRIMCGDSTDAGSVALLMGGGMADLLVSDPPYGIGYEYAEHDDSSNEENANLVASAFAHGPAVKVWTPGLPNLARDIARFGKAKVLVWFKKFAAAGSGLGGASVWEPVLVVGRPKVTKLPTDVIEKMTDREQVGGVDLRKLHTCPKPVGLYSVLIDAFTAPGDSVHDPFSGSGTTIIAAEQTGRRCYAMELSPQYVDVAVRRWQEFTGQRAVREADGMVFPA